MASIHALPGDADILVCPDLEAANAVANLLIYLAGADAAGIVLGARVPILLRTHAGNALSRQASAGLAQLVSHYVHGAAARPLSAVAR